MTMLLDNIKVVSSTSIASSPVWILKEERQMC